MCSSKIACATGISAGWATQVPSWPAVTSRSLSARTRAIACSLAAASWLIGICAAMPPIACAPRRWQVRISSSEYAFRNGWVMVTWPRSGSTLSAWRRKVLM
ncbi:hypothetical protein D3C81_2109710 [compost metagenome]